MKKRIIYTGFIAMILTMAFVVYAASTERFDFETKGVEKESTAFSKDMLKEGDVIFQTSSSGQSLAIQISTDSKFSHCGLLFKEDGEWMVFEAVQPVKKTSLDEFVGRGDNDWFSIMRLKDDGQLTDKSVMEMKSFFLEIEGLNYDIYFDWSDKQWYCSELVWKMYDEVGIQISEYEKFGDFELDHPVVEQIVKDRFPNGAPLEETVITPKGIHSSDKMIEVYSNYSENTKKKKYVKN